MGAVKGGGDGLEGLRKVGGGFGFGGGIKGRGFGGGLAERRGREGFEVLGFVAPVLGWKRGRKGGWVKGDGFGEGMKGWWFSFGEGWGRFRQRGKGVKVLRI
ncbi:uncharacterized protein G2W53_009801 [Senna tora]|uniref:Uncharacterized protein n=1 Tax=Senna tora TaxID=362788 RepID=A0A834WZI5_9FABA|nr:uncharacterized protein G2W53_009801 [Senna tora]